MSQIALYIDEDSSDTRLVDALRQHGIDVATAQDAGLLGKSDSEQLRWAFENNCPIYTSNAKDFCAMHFQKLRDSKEHAGIIIGQQQTLSIGEQLRRLQRLLKAKPGSSMRNSLEFLSNW